MYICIDLKSFYASCECVELGLDPMTAKLAVADKSRGNGSICLAVSPAMKADGIKNRCRLFEIPSGYDFICAKPRMSLYMKYSAKIFGIYMKYVSPEDVHIYSVDECFIDISRYTKLYNTTPREFCKMLMDAVMRETKIPSSAGIGTNLFLCKVALDITAKHNTERIGELDEESFKKEIWYHKPITDIWQIGQGIAKRLYRVGIVDLHGIAIADTRWLYREFGKNAEFLIDHANGREDCTIFDIHEYTPKSSSVSQSQILFEDYNYDDALIILLEMVNSLLLELIRKKLASGGVSLTVSYSKNVILPTGANRKLPSSTNSYKKLIPIFEELYRETTKKDFPIRRIAISFNNLCDERMSGIDIFTDVNAEAKERELLRTLIVLKQRYGKNILMKGISYTDKATGLSRNKMIGGHNGE